MVELIPMSVAISGPLKEQWGYLFVDEFGSTEDYRTLSHELGHGRTALPHTFKDEHLSQGSTTNLMDYVDPGSFPPNGGSGWEGATDLVRAQWDMVHNPAIFTPLQSDGDGADVGFAYAENGVLTSEPIDIESHTFFTPAGYPITFNSDKYLFITTESFESKIIDSKGITLNITAPVGALCTFNYDSDVYKGNYKINSEGVWNFEGYRKYIKVNDKLVITNDWYIDENFTANLPNTYKANFWQTDPKKVLQQVDCDWQIDCPQLFPDGISNYKGAGVVVSAINPTPIQDLKDKYAPLFSSSPALTTAINNNPCALYGMRSIGEGLGYETEFMKGLWKMVNAGLAATFAVPVAEMIVIPILEDALVLCVSEAATLASYLTKEVAKNAIIGASIDLCLQSFILMTFEDVPPQELWKKIDYGQTAVTGLESIVDNVFLSTFITPIFYATTDNGMLKSGVNFNDFYDEYLLSASIALGVNVAIKVATGQSGLAKALKNNILKLKQIANKHPNPKLFIRQKLNEVIPDNIASEIDGVTSKEEVVDKLTELFDNFDDLGNWGDVGDLLSIGRGQLDNTIDVVAIEAKEAAENVSEIICTNQPVSAISGAKAFWAQHEANVTKQLRTLFGTTNVGRQISVDIYIQGVSGPIECRFDNLIYLGGSKFQVVDAKSSTVIDLSKETAKYLASSQRSTSHQRQFYQALAEGKVTQIKPKGDRAVEYFRSINMNVPNNMDINNTIDFYVNDVSTPGYTIFKKTLIF